MEGGGGKTRVGGGTVDGEGGGTFAVGGGDESTGDAMTGVPEPLGAGASGSEDGGEGAEESGGFASNCCVTWVLGTEGGGAEPCGGVEGSSWVEA